MVVPIFCLYIIEVGDSDNNTHTTTKRLKRACNFSNVPRSLSTTDEMYLDASNSSSD